MAYTEQQGFDPAQPDDEKDLYRDVLALKNGAQEKIEIKTGYPNLKEMADGAITLRYVPGQGVFLFVKYLNRLFNTRLAEEGRTGIQIITDSTGGTVSDTVDDTTVTQRDDVATLAAKVNEIIGKL